MKGSSDHFGGHELDASRSPSPNIPLLTLVVVIFAECALMAAASVFLLVELFVDVPLSYASAVAILVCAAIATAFLLMLGIHTLRGSPWIRSGATVWQVLQAAVGVGALQGAYAQPAIGWALIAPAVVAFVLIFNRQVVAATQRDD